MGLLGKKTETEMSLANAWKTVIRTSALCSVFKLFQLP